MERFIIIDGNAILHRAFHAMPPFTTSSGILVNAVYGFASMLIKLRDGFNPSYLAVTFDLPKPTFRKKIYKEYQIKRPKMDESLVSQVELVKKLVRVLGIPIYEKEGFEADDVIGTLAAQAAKFSNSNIQNPNKFQNQNNNDKNRNDSLEIIIVTGDRDILQLVDENVKVYMPVRGITEAVLYDSEKVKEKFGILPELIPDYKGLVGDQSDNYPGVEGIGPKTAEDLLKKFGSFTGIYKSLEDVKGGVREKLIAGRENGEMSYKLAAIMRDIPVTLDLKICRIKDFERPETIKFFEEMEFRSLIKRLGKVNSLPAQAGKKLIVNNKMTKNEEDKRQMSLFG